MTSFVGRESELVGLRRLLSTTRFLTLTGSGGIGKTRLALRLAGDVAATYPEGVWLVELSSLSNPDLVPRAVAGALGVPEQPRRTLFDVLADALRHRCLLLVLDNCEHVVEACAALADRLLRSCAGLAVLATSREPLGVPGETTWRVPALAVPDRGGSWTVEQLTRCEAVQLFMDRARAVLPNMMLTAQNAPAVVEVCRRLEGVPLAIELAAARVRVLDPEQIAWRLEDRLGLLTGGSRTAPPRQQTLRATLDWSYDLLDGAERRLFERLAVFAGGWTLEAAEAVCAGDGIEAVEVLDLLMRLVDKSLVLAEPAADGRVRYRMLETLREYGFQQLTARGRADAILVRHAAFFLGLAEERGAVLGPDADSQMRADRLERDHDNIRAALRRLVARGDVVAAQRLGGALGHFWLFRGHLTEGRSWLAELLALQGAEPRSATRAKLLHGASLLALYQGDSAARAPAEEALELWRAFGDPVELAHSLYVLGMQQWLCGERERARALLREGLEAGRAAGDSNLIALNLRGLAETALDADEYSEARTWAEETLNLTTDPRLICHALRILVGHLTGS